MIICMAAKSLNLFRLLAFRCLPFCIKSKVSLKSKNENISFRIYSTLDTFHLCVPLFYTFPSLNE